MEDDNSDESSEIDSNALLFFSAGPNDSSVEADEMNSWHHYYNDAKNEGGEVGTTGQVMGKSYPPLQRSIQQRWQPSMWTGDQGGA